MKRQFRKLTRTPTGPVTCTRGVGTFFCDSAHVFSGPAQRLHGHCVSFQRSTLPGQLVSRLDLHSRGSESLAECLKKCKPRATKNGEISVSHLFAKHRTRFCPSENTTTHTWFGSCKNATERFPWVGSGWWFWNTAALHCFLRQRNRF